MKSVKKHQFEDYLERANAAGSVEALFKVFVDDRKPARPRQDDILVIDAT